MMRVRGMCECVFLCFVPCTYVHSPARADLTDALVRMLRAGRLFDRFRFQLLLRSADVFNQHNGTVDDVRTGDRVFRGGNIGLQAQGWRIQ